jgi:hypothetical protein
VVSSATVGSGAGDGDDGFPAQADMIKAVAHRNETVMLFMRVSLPAADSAVNKILFLLRA